MTETQGSFEHSNSSGHLPELSDEELQELAVALAFESWQLESALDLVSRPFSSHMEAENRAAHTEIEHIKLDIAHIESSSVNRGSIDSLVKDLEAQQEALTIEKCDLEKRIASDLAHVKRLRFEEGREELKLMSERLSRGCGTSLAEEAEQAREQYQLELEAYLINADENKRRADDLQSELQRIDAEIAIVSKRTFTLQESGVTKSSAGFLVWAGYSCLAATGLAMSCLLQAHESGIGPGPLVHIWRLLTSFVPQQPQSPWQVLLPIIILAGGLGALTLIVIGIDKLLQETRLGWRLHTPKSQSQSSSHLMSMPNFRVKREHFTQLIAVIPFIIAAGFFISFIHYSQTGTDVSDLGESFSNSVAALYVGTAVMLLAATVSVLYSALVIQRRIVDNNGKTSQNPLRLFWEFPVILAFGLVAVFVSAFVPKSVASDLWAWGWVVAFLLLSSLAFGCGITFRGYFKDLDSKESLRMSYRTETARLLDKPRLSLPNPDHEGGADDRWLGKSRRDLVTAVNEITALFTLSGILEPEDIEVSMVTSYWYAIRNRMSRRKTQVPTGFVSDNFRPFDYSVAGEFIATIAQTRVQASAINQRLSTIARQIGELRAKLEPRVERERRERVHELRSSLRHAESRWATRLAEIESRRDRLCLRFRSAFIIAATAMRIGNPLAGPPADAANPDDLSPAEV